MTRILEALYFSREGATGFVNRFCLSWKMESNDDFNLVKRILLHEPDLRGFRFFDKEASIPEQALKAEWTEELMSVLIDKKKIEALGLGTGLNFASDNSC